MATVNPINTSHPAGGYLLARKEEEHARLYSSLTLNERLNNRVLDVRVAATASIFKLMSGVFRLAAEYQANNDFHWISTPHIVNYNITGDNDYFPVDYFGRQDAWLAQTGEFHQQMAIAMGFDRVFEIRTLFRAEDQVSARRLTEFSGLEAVMALKDTWEEVTDSAEGAFIHIIRGLQQMGNYTELIAIAAKMYSSAGTFKLGLDNRGKMVRLKFIEAKQLLRSAGHETDDEVDFTQEEEAVLGRMMRDPSLAQSHHRPATDIFTISHYPAHLRTFYMQKSDTDEGKSNTFDVILRGQENCSGGQTIHEPTALRAAMRARSPSLDPDSPRWKSYIGAFEAGSPPQGSYGIGLNRLVQGFLGLSDIHEAALFPRDVSRLNP